MDKNETDFIEMGGGVERLDSFPYLHQGRV